MSISLRWAHLTVLLAVMAGRLQPGTQLTHSSGPTAAGGEPHSLGAGLDLLFLSVSEVFEHVMS